MRRQGSVLVVVLGLLAILSVIGVAFITMSGLDRSTSASFAMQTQLALAADGAVDYVCHYLVQDVWTDGSLLRGVGECERYDYPGDEDLWFAGTFGGTDNAVSFACSTTERFGIEFGGKDTAEVDNDGDGTDDGIWIPDLAAPFDQYIVRASVTVLDHGGLLNVNAHGHTSTGWEYAAIAGNGCFISDVDAAGLGGVALDRWGADGPCNPTVGETIIENPRTTLKLDDGTTINVDRPFTLAEEFLLRVRNLPDFNSRLSADVKTNAEKYTTVSWTAEVCGDGNALEHATAEDAEWSWSAPKANLNLAEPQAIYDALLNSGAFADPEALQQFVANIIAFRDRDNTFETDFENKVGAERQPFFSEIVVTRGATVDGKTEWTVEVEVFNPWPGDSAGQTNGLSVHAFTVRADGADNPNAPLPSVPIPYKQCFAIPDDFIVQVDAGAGEIRLSDKLKKIELVVNGAVVVDRLSADEIDMASTAVNGRLYRMFGVGEEQRASILIPVVFIYEWKKGETPNLGTPEVVQTGGNTGIPIRILNSVPDKYSAMTEGPLPPYPTKSSDENFKALVRLGDLNQVMCPSVGGDWWGIPWAVRVTQEKEEKVRFDWVAHPQAADVLCVQGPWLDGFDNDGDGYTDLYDKGSYNDGRFSGPEFRVAGKINLNTARSATLPSLGISALSRPLSSIAEIISGGGGSLESRDKTFCRFSNIITVRSDVFSIYGTVQILDPAKAPSSGIVAQDDDAVVRSRRFWALVDRSPSLAYPPGDGNFIHPRRMNFHWME